MHEHEDVDKGPLDGQRVIDSSAVQQKPVSDFLGHPKGLWVLFLTEMWERFSYYGMRALLVLYLIARTDEINAGFGWAETSAHKLYGLYTMAVYLTPLAGGIIADRILGTHRSMLIGGIIIACGHLTLAFTEFFVIQPGVEVSISSSPGALICFISGLVLIVIGTGFFKPCVSVMVGQLYALDDPRRDGGFTIFYMGINLGALLSPLIAGSLGERVGWHWGFGAAAVGMITGLVCYQWLRPRFLAGIGLPPPQRDPTKSTTMSAGEASASPRSTASDRETWEKIGVILILALLGNIFFWTAFEQAGTSMSVFAAKMTDRTLFGFEFPATWYQAVNPAAILVFAPVFAWLWVWLDRRQLNPSTPLKFSLGLFLLGIAFIAMVFGAMRADSDGLAGPHWLLMTYVIYTWGELCLSPVGLSMVTKLTPPAWQSLMMGVWFLSLAAANLLGGLVAAFSKRVEAGEVTFFIEGLPGFYLMLVVFPLAAGMLLLLLSPMLKRMMHGVQ